MKILILLIVLLLAGCNQKPIWAEVNLQIIAQIESSNNPSAYNKSSGAVGLYQITTICLEDYNQLNKRQYALNEMFDPNKAYIVANWYMNKRILQLLKHYKLPDNLSNRLWCYNAGIGQCKKGVLPTETRNYILKYIRLDKMED